MTSVFSWHRSAENLHLSSFLSLFYILSSAETNYFLKFPPSPPHTLIPLTEQIQLLVSRLWFMCDFLQGADKAGQVVELKVFTDPSRFRQ